MTPKQQVHIKWNWQLSSSPEQLWTYVADTNRLFKDLNLPAVQPTDIPYDLKKAPHQLSCNSIKKYPDVWIEEPFEWEYPFRYGVKRRYKNGPYKEVKIQVDLFPNRKGTRLQYQLWAIPKHFFTAALSTFKHKTIQRTRLKNIFKYYDELAELNCLPYEVRFKNNLFLGDVKRLNEIREAFIDATGLQGTAERMGTFVHQIVRRARQWYQYWINDRVLGIGIKKITGIRKALAADLRDMANRLDDFAHRAVRRLRLRRAAKYYNIVTKRAQRFYQNQLKKRLLRPGIKRLNGTRETLINAVELKSVAGKQIEVIHRIVQHSRLKRDFAYYTELAEKSRLHYQAQFNKRLNNISKTLINATDDLKDTAERLVNFVQQAISRMHLKEIASYYSEFGEKHRRLYRARFKKSLVRIRDKRLNEIREILNTNTGLKKIVDRLIGFINQADDIDLIRIEPYQLADYWQFKRKDVLFVFLHAAKEGLLDFNWDLYCPSCRTVQQSCKTLSEVHEPVFCGGCSNDFTINFNQTIQLSFRPNPLVRKISDGEYCSANPHSKSHIVIQQNLKSGQKRYLKTRLQEGVYHLWTSNSEGRATVLVNEDGQDTVNIRCSSRGLKGEQTNICCEPNLIFENSTQKDQTFILEKAAWHDTGITAAQITSLQIFRDLFAQEVPHKGEKIAVDKLTLMFTDLFDSTAMYNKEGDNQAVGRVIEHFEILQQAVTKEKGALVKTIGDSIMAVFSNPDQAFRAFISAKKTISEDPKFEKSLKLKAGIHHGNCVAVNLNNRIDYFGSTVNIASRLVDLANENEVIISESVSRDDKIHRLLADNISHCIVEQERANLKGFDKETFNIKRIRFEKSLLRLAI